MKQTKIDIKNTRIGKAIPVTGANLGGWKDGDIIGADVTVQEFIEVAVRVEVPVTYTSPTGSITSSVSGNVEAGTLVTPNINANFSQNDGGALTKYVLKRGNTILVDAASIQAFSDSFTAGDGTVNYRATFSYGIGPIKKNNFDQDVPAGRISAGSVDSNSISVSGRRYAFYDVNKPTSTSAEVRAMSGKVLNAGNGASFTIDIPAGSTSVEFAYLATLNDPSKVLHQESNLDVKAVFSKALLDVEGANGFTAASYKVFRYTPTAPFSGANKFTVTI